MPHTPARPRPEAGRKFRRFRKFLVSGSLFQVSGFEFLVSGFWFRGSCHFCQWWSLVLNGVNQSWFLVSRFLLFAASDSPPHLLSVIHYLLSIICYLRCLAALPSALPSSALPGYRDIGFRNIASTSGLPTLICYLRRLRRCYLLSVICYLLSALQAALISAIYYPLSTICCCVHARMNAAATASADTTLSEFFCP